MKSKKPFQTSGTTLTELMISVAIIGVAFIALLNTFGAITKAIQRSKGKTLASNLAQEKIHILRQVSYHRLMVTPSPSYDTEFSPSIPYDNTYYPPEVIHEGGITFIRYTYVQMASETGSDLAFLGATPDTGMKAITTTVIWKEALKSKKIQLKTIYSNPDTVRTTCVFSGEVKDSLTNNPIDGALVRVLENLAWQDVTPSTGVYNINVYDGSYTLAASARGYESQTLFTTIAPYATQTNDFDLVPIDTGTIYGMAFVNPHLVISNVVASTTSVDGFDQEFIELYNPTTHYIQMAAGMNASLVNVYYEGDTPGINNIQFAYKVMDSSISPSGYFLFANTDTIKVWTDFGLVTKDADAVYQPWLSLDIIEESKEGAVGIGYDDGSGGIIWIDKVGWSKNSGAKTAPFCEGTAIQRDDGLEPDEQFVRRTFPGRLDYGAGRAYDSGNNNIDFVVRKSTFYPPHNKADTELLMSGQPAYGAIASCNDGLSDPTSTVISNWMGVDYPIYRIPSVAVGTWQVIIAKDNYSLLIQSVTIPSRGYEIYIPSSTTNPQEPAPGVWAALLNQEVEGGFLSGSVLDASGNPIAGGIQVRTSAGSSCITDTSGNFFMHVSTGIFNVSANELTSPIYKPTYVSQTIQNITVNYGQITSGVDFLLAQGGSLKGWVTRDGINPLPSVSIVALDVGGAARAQDISASDGYFTLINLSTGGYTVEPVLDSGETTTPEDIGTTVATGQTVFVGTFTITGAFGSITGSVTDNSEPISTGVLIVASTATFTDPPTLDSGATSGAPYYFANSYENGTYSIDVRGSAQSYRVKAYYTNVGETSVTTQSLIQNNVNVTPSATTSGVDFDF